MAGVFQGYYSSLYSVRQKGSQAAELKRTQKIQEYLKEASLPKVSVERLQALEELIPQEEIKLALKNTVTGESPGPDGFTRHYYKKFKEQLIPSLFLYMNGLNKGNEMRRESLQTYITVIPREGKDATLCSSFRPITLLKIDTK